MESSQDHASRPEEESAPPPGNLQDLAGVPGMPKESKVWDATRAQIEAAGYAIDALTPAKGGASAVVLKGRERGTKRDVALKVIVDPTSERSKKLLEREAKMLTAEGLPAVVVRYYKKLESAAQKHQPVLVLEWIDGESLGEFLRRGQLSVERRLELTRELFERLAELHESGWFWRDLSPNNILVERKTSRLRFIDFGLAKLQADRQASIHTLGPGGTPYFTKDAILSGEIQATVQDDVRAAAMMALRVLGVENAKTKTASGEALRERKELVRELRSHEVPGEFGERVVDVLIAAEHRPESTPSAKEVAERLTKWFEERAQRRRRARLLLSLVAISVVLATVLAFGWLLYRKEVRSSRLAGVEVLQQELSRRPNLNHPAVQSLLGRAQDLQARLQSALGGQFGAGDDQTLTELLSVQREALAASHDLEAAEPLRRSLGEVLVHTPWEPEATIIDQRKKQAAERMLACGRHLDEGRFDEAWAGLRALERDLAQLAADNATAVRAARARSDYRRLDRGLTDRLRALPQYGPIAARALDAERLFGEGRYDDSRGPGAGTEFAQAKAQLETLLIQQETQDERRQRLTQDETTIATLETRIQALEQERSETQTRLEQFQSLLTRAESERTALELDKQALQVARDAASTKISELESELSTTKQARSALETVSAGMRSDLSARDKRIQELDAELATARSEQSKAQERSKRLDSDLASARKEVESLRRQLVEAGSRPAPSVASSRAESSPSAGSEGAAAALAQPGRGRSHVNSIGMKLLGVDAGTFQMGSPERESGRYGDEKLHGVTLSRPFWMAETEVTQGQWTAVMGAAPRGGFDRDNLGAEVAANTLDWNEAMDFCRRLTDRERQEGLLPEGFEYTLPTEAQWEYACRAGTRTAYSFGDDASKLGQYAVHDGSRDGAYAHRVKSRKPNPWGFYDMHGNVWEWCLDAATGVGAVVTDTYREGIRDPLAQGGPQRVFRGGSWDYSPAGCRSALRNAVEPSGADAHLGFRPVLAPRSGGGARLSPSVASSAAESSPSAGSEGAATALAQPGRGRSHVNSIGMKLLGVDAGTFQMGSSERESGRDSDETLHGVTLSRPFWMAETEVTQGQWTAVMGAASRGGFDWDNLGAEVAANTLDWNEAMDFCRRLTEQERQAGLLPEGFEYTLPTEAQWEYACRAGTRTAYSFGDDTSKLGQYAVYGDSRDGAYANRVKSRKPNPWGFYDMHGNVWEWCLDSYGGDEDTYRDGITDPLAQGGPRRVHRGGCRGGSWYNSPAHCRSANRSADEPFFADYSLGFRPVLAPRSEGGAR